MRASTDLPDDVLLSLALGRVWEAFELTGWHPQRSPLRPEAFVLYHPDGTPDWETLEQTAQDRAAHDFQRADRRKAIRSVREALDDAAKPTNPFRRIFVGEQLVAVCATMPSRQKRRPSVLGALATVANAGLLDRAGFRWAYCRFPG